MSRIQFVLVCLAVLSSCSYVRSPTEQECSLAVDNRLRVEAASELGEKHPFIGRFLGNVAASLSRGSSEHERLTALCLAGNQHQALCEMGAMNGADLKTCR